MTGTKTYKVIIGLILINKINDTTEVKVPPINCTKPVPMRFLTPSTSVIMRDTNAPDLELSK